MSGLTSAVGHMILGRLGTLGWRPTRAVNHVINLGYGFRRTEMFKTYHRTRNLTRLRPTCEAFDIEAKPTREIMGQVDFIRPRKYKIHGIESYFDEDLQDWQEKRISWYTDKSLTKRDWAEDYIEQTEEEENYPQRTTRSVSVINIEHNRRYPY
ncbi:hypothetical protein ES703_44127 [subsurface metagenome]